MLLAVLSMSVEIRDVFCTYCITFNQQLPGPPAQQVFWISFSPPSMRTMGCKKKSFGKGAGKISSNCLVIGKWFFLSHYLPCRMRARQMWRRENSLLQAGCALGPGRWVPAHRPVICLTPVLISSHPFRRERKALLLSFWCSFYSMTLLSLQLVA